MGESGYHRNVNANSEAHSKSAHEGLKCPPEMTLERSGTSVAHCGDNIESDSRRLRNK